MKFKTVDLSDKNEFEELADLYYAKRKADFTKTPVMSVDDIRKFLKAKERPTHHLEFYFIQEDDKTIGMIFVRINKITDKDQLGLTIYVKPKHYTDEIFEAIIINIVILYDQGSYSLVVTEAVREKVDQLHRKEEIFTGLDGKLVYQERINITELDQFDLDDVINKSSKLKKKANDRGYKIIEIEDGNFKSNPEINYHQHLEMVEAIWNDMPSEDADWDDEVVTDEIFEAIFENMRERGQQAWSFVAVEQTSGDSVGVTDIWLVPGVPEVVHQGDTGVISDHRGNRLGKTLKYQMLEKILTDERTQQAMYWMTENAHSNKHMEQINDELGYKEWYRQVWYEIPLSSIREKFD